MALLGQFCECSDGPVACLQAFTQGYGKTSYDIKKMEKTQSEWQKAVSESAPGVLGNFDGKLLADYVVFLKQQRDKDSALALWLADNAMSMPDPQAVEEGKKLMASLTKSWAEYVASPEGKGNFKDSSEWGQLDLPSSDINEKVSKIKGKTLVSKDDEMYPFAVAAMVGIHVAVVCSDIIAGHLSSASTLGKDGLKTTWLEKFKKNNLTSIHQQKCRCYKIPNSGTAYSPKTILPGTITIKEYCPELFSEMRRLSGIKSRDLFRSVCRIDFEFITFGTNSKSGEVFFFSHDNKMMIKTTTYQEANTLCTMLPGFIDRFESSPQSLLGRYMGLYELTLPGEKPKLFFVMLNVAGHSYPISHGYDVKGSTKNRDAPGDFIGKDMDFVRDIEKFGLLPDVSEQLAITHKKDCAMLRQFGIMDFSFLIQVHDSKGELGGDGKKKDHEFANGSAGVKLKDSASSAVSWFEKTTDRLFSTMKTEIAAEVTNSAGWRPSTGIWSADGRYLFAFGLIDILVPFSLYPKAQYIGEEIISAGKGKQYSRVPPQYYFTRQVAFVHNACGVPVDS